MVQRWLSILSLERKSKNGILIPVAYLERHNKTYVMFFAAGMRAMKDIKLAFGLHGYFQNRQWK